MKLKTLNADNIKLDISVKNSDTSTDENYKHEKHDNYKIDKNIAKRIDAIFVGDDEYIINVLPLDLYSYIIGKMKDNTKSMLTNTSYDMDGNFDIVKDQIRKFVENKPDDGYPYTLTIRTALMCILNIKYLNYGIIPSESLIT